MYRSASPRNRPPQSVGSRPRPSLSNGGNIVQLDQWRKRQAVKRTPPGPVSDGPATGVHVSPCQEVPRLAFKKRRRTTNAVTPMDVKASLRQSMALVSGYFQLRVLNQYVRCVLQKDGLEEYLTQVTNRRLRQMGLAKNPSTFARIWREELKLLLSQARAYVGSAARTGEATRRGYHILRGIGPRGKPVFITLHDSQEQVVGIYSGKQWNHKRANRSRRCESHRQAKTFRKQKSRLTPR